MDIVFITDPAKMKVLGIDLSQFFENLNSSISDSTNNNTLHYISDCNDCDELEKDEKELINDSIALLSEIITRDNYLIIRHSNMHQEIIDILVNNNVDANRVKNSIHELNQPNNHWYLLLPSLVNDDEFTKRFLADFDNQVDESEMLNQKLTLLYKLLNKTLLTKDSLREEFEEEEKELLQPYFDYKVEEDEKDQKTARLRHLRDVLLKDVI